MLRKKENLLKKFFKDKKVLEEGNSVINVIRIRIILAVSFLKV